MELEVGVDGDVDPVPLALRPPNEDALPVVPPRGPRPAAEAMQIGPRTEVLVLGIVDTGDVRISDVGFRLGEEAWLKRPTERDLRRAGVQTRTTPVVVGVVGVGGEHE